MKAIMATYCFSLLFLTVAFLAAPKLTSAVVDLTRSPGARGQSVVQAVVDVIHQSCIFQNDKNFLRRLAYVESRDGANGNTYRNQYDGGIWQVDENRFLDTKAKTKYFPGIRQKFNIEWSQVTWKDLRKPLYSGLAARLVIEISIQGAEIPTDIPHQAVIWQGHYHYPRPATGSFAVAASLEQACHKDKKLEVVFLLDSSGSVSREDFDRAKEFVVRWIDAFTIGPDATRVGVITFSSRVVVNMYLPKYTTKSSLIQHVRSIQYLGGQTYTHTAINTAANTVLSPKQGARLKISRVIILITDGQSNVPSETKAAADKAKKAGITIFSVGVGNNINADELKNAASFPQCMHVYKVANFGEIDVLKQEMQEASCDSKIHLDTNTHSNNSNGTSGIACKLGSHCDTIAVNIVNSTGSTNVSGQAIVTTVNCGSATVYAAYNNPNPGVAYYEIKAVATNDTPAVLLLNKTGTVLYITVEGHPYRVDLNRTASCEAVTTVVDKTDLPTEVTVVCKEGGKERECTLKDLEEFKPTLCEETYAFNNPCTRDNLDEGNTKFPYVHDNEKYLMCDLVGNDYVVHCPKDRVYNPHLKSCGLSTGSPGHTTGTRTPLDPKETNPCTVNFMSEGQMQFSYTKSLHKFIICDVWGGAWLYECKDGFMWYPQNMQCVVNGTIDHVQGPGPLDQSIPNPCTVEMIEAGQIFFPYPLAADRFIQCDMYGDAFVMLCFQGGHWSVAAGTCTTANIT